jgi:hypothetical protein
MFMRRGPLLQLREAMRKIDGGSKRVYVVTANIFDGGGDEG